MKSSGVRYSDGSDSFLGTLELLRPNTKRIFNELPLLVSLLLKKMPTQRHFQVFFRAYA